MASLLASIITQQSLVAVRHGTNDILRAKMKIWWSYARFIMLLSVILTTVGIYNFLTSLTWLDRIKFNDGTCWTPRMYWQTIGIAGTSVICLCVLGLSVRPVNRMLRGEPVRGCCRKSRVQRFSKVQSRYISQTSFRQRADTSPRGVLWPPPCAGSETWVIPAQHRMATWGCCRLTLLRERPQWLQH